MKSPRLRHCDWRRAQMPQKEPAQMSRTDAKTFCQRVHATILQSALVDQAQSARHRIRSAEPSRRPRRTLRTTTQTGAKTSFGSRRRARKVTDIAFLGGSRRADRPAVDAAGAHSDEELAVEARIARKPRPRTDSPIQSHLHVIIKDKSISDGRFRTFLDTSPIFVTVIQCSFTALRTGSENV